MYNKNVLHNNNMYIFILPSLSADFSRTASSKFSSSPWFSPSSSSTWKTISNRIQLCSLIITIKII